MKSLLEKLNDSLIFEEDGEVYVVKDKDDGTIITVKKKKKAANEVVKTSKQDNPDNNYEVVKDKKSNYVK